MFKIVYSRIAVKQIKNLKGTNLIKKFESIINVIKNNPYQIPPPYEKLFSGLKNAYSRRINVKHRLVYRVSDENKKIYVLGLWSHYEEI